MTTAASFDPGAASDLTTTQRILTLATVVLASSLYGTALLTTSTILPQMQGAMSATQDEIAWAMTFNILATAIVTPMTGWLVARFGQKRVMVWSIGVFTLATMACGMSQSLETLVFWRIIQGGTGAPVPPWIIRQNTSVSSDCDIPHAIVASVNTPIDHTMTRFWPKRATSQPVIGVTIAVARMLKVIAQAISSCVADIAPCICGRIGEVVSRAVP